MKKTTLLELGQFSARKVYRLVALAPQCLHKLLNSNDLFTRPLQSYTPERPLLPRWTSFITIDALT